MDLLAMRTYIRRMLNEEGESDGFYSDAELNVLINEATKEFVRIFPKDKIGDIHELVDSETYSSTDGSETLPTDFDMPLSVKYGDYYATILSYVNGTAMNDNEWYASATVEPIAYFLGTQLVVSPTPSTATAIVLTYIKIPTTLSADTDEVEIKDNFHEMICLGALERAKIKDNEIDEAHYHFGRMKKMLYDYYGMLTPEERIRR